MTENKNEKKPEKKAFPVPIDESLITLSNLRRNGDFSGARLQIQTTKPKPEERSFLECLLFEQPDMVARRNALTGRDEMRSDYVAFLYAMARGNDMAFSKSGFHRVWTSGTTSETITFEISDDPQNPTPVMGKDALALLNAYGGVLGGLLGESARPIKLKDAPPEIRAKLFPTKEKE